MNASRSSVRLVAFALAMMLAFVASAQSRIVYTSSSPVAKVFHSSDTCRGLKSAKSPVIARQLHEATTSYRQCKLCFKPDTVIRVKKNSASKPKSAKPKKVLKKTIRPDQRKRHYIDELVDE